MPKPSVDTIHDNGLSAVAHYMEVPVLAERPDGGYAQKQSADEPQARKRDQTGVHLASIDGVLDRGNGVRQQQKSLENPK